jgi:hypothetical protein
MPRPGFSEITWAGQGKERGRGFRDIRPNPNQASSYAMRACKRNRHGFLWVVSAVVVRTDTGGEFTNPLFFREVSRINSGVPSGAGQFATSDHDRRSPPRMNMWDNSGDAAGPEVVCSHGAPEPVHQSDPESRQAPPTVACEPARQDRTIQVATRAVLP